MRESNDIVLEVLLIQPDLDSDDGFEEYDEMTMHKNSIL